MSNMNATLGPNYQIVQDFVDENLTETRFMTVKNIYNKIKDRLLGSIQEKAFIAAFRADYKAGIITGIKGVRAKGYHKKGANVKAAKEDVKVANEDTVTKLNVKDENEIKLDETPAIYLRSNLRIVRLDKHNWSIQHRTSELWIGFAFYPSAELCFKKAAEHLLSGRFASGEFSATDMSGVARLFSSLKNEIVEEIRAAQKLALEEVTQKNVA